MSFSAGEVCFRYPDGRPEWHVDASWDGHTVLARAVTQRIAWQLAAKQAGRLIRQGVLLVVLICSGCGLSVEQGGQETLPMDSPAADVTEDPPDPNDWHGRH